MRRRGFRIGRKSRPVLTVLPVRPRGLRGRQKFIEITEPVVAWSMNFRFAQPLTRLDVISKAGTEIARDGGDVIVTPHDNCVIVQPSMRHLGVNVTMMRLGRSLDR